MKVKTNYANTPAWREVNVKSRIPEPLKMLERMARNIWWAWNDEATEMFKELDPELWKAVGQNPVALLERLSYEKLEDLSADKATLKKINDVYSKFEAYMNEKPDASRPSVAYFCMEYGLTHVLKIYSGGLGILAGDYLKEASDSNVDMCGIGFLYRYGYFKQTLSMDGQQIANYEAQNFGSLPLERVVDAEGKPLVLDVPYLNYYVHACVWRVNVGRVPLYLLDTDNEMNSEFDRSITYQLYGGDWENRLKQEILLGIGGVLLLKKLGIKKDVYHCNEGHAALCNVQRLCDYVESGMTFDEALEVVRASSLYTVHTPVPAGHDYFDEGLFGKYMGGYPQRMGITWDELMDLGRINPGDHNERFCMSTFACNTCQEVNGVSWLHGKVSQEMFSGIWKGYFPEENHVGYVTNGVHLPTWADAKWQRLFSKVMGEDYLDNQSDFTVWEKMQDVPASEIWDIRKELKHNLMEFIKVKLAEDMRKRQESPSLIIKTIDSLDENALIIGFARRFATYKRAHLLFTNLERLAEIVNNPKRPVIFVFAGKAHPNDKAGQDLIKNIIEVSRKKEFIGKILFISNYDIEIGKMLTSSVDIWLNTPTRPLEASGTSGEKAAMNGVLNFSVLDGWWAEGYRPDAGWAIKEERTYQDQRYQDELDAETIYNMLEDEITPLYFTRNADGVPETWVQYIKNNFMEIAPFYTMKRMLDDYFSQYYDKLIKRTKFMRADRYSKAFELTAWRKKIESHWDTIEVSSIKVPDPNIRALNLGDVFIAEITLKIPGLDKNDIGIELMFAEKENDVITKILRVEQMTMVDYGDEWVRFYISLPVFKAGVYNYTFRIYPTNKMLAHRQDLPLVKWI